MTERQFRMLMEQLQSINEKLTALAVSGANQEVVANALVEAMSAQGEEPASTDAYFNQSLIRQAIGLNTDEEPEGEVEGPGLLRGDDLHAG